MRKFILLPITLAALAGCATGTSSSYLTALDALQIAAPALEAAIATYPSANTPAVAKAETDLNAALAALAASPAPSSANAVLADVQAVAAAMPSNVLSPQHQAEIGSTIALARLVVSSLSTSTPAAS